MYITPLLKNIYMYLIVQYCAICKMEQWLCLEYNVLLTTSISEGFNVTTTSLIRERKTV